MLNAKTEEQRQYIESLLDKEFGNYRTASHAHVYNDKEVTIEVQYDDGYGEVCQDITFETMAKIVDYLRNEDAKRRQKARRAALKSGADGLWVSGDTIFLGKGGVEFDSKSGTLKAPANDVERFINSLGALDYDVSELMEEYKQKGKITI